jgi:ABC-type transport system substrate-binding protein
MKKITVYPLVVVFLIVSLLLTGCQLTGSEASSASTTFQPLRDSTSDCSYGGEIKSVEAVDQYTVRFTLCSADVAFPAKITSPVFSIQDSGFLTANQGDSTKLSRQTNGTGPYRVSTYTQGQRLVLETNPDYWGIPPKAKRVLITWSADPNRRFTALQFGSVDLIDNPATANQSAIQLDANLKLEQRPLLNVIYIGFNVGIAPFDQLEFRQGIALGLDRSALVQNSFLAGVETAEQFVPNSLTPGYSSGVKWYAFNSDQATSMLKRSGYDLSHALALSYPSTSPDPSLPSLQQLALNISRQLAAVGVKIVLNPMPLNDFQKAVQQGKIGFFLDYQTADYADSVAFYNENFTGSTPKFGPAFADLKKQVLSASSSSDSILRQQYYDAANGLIKQYIPVIPIAHVNGAYASKAQVENVVVGPYNENYPEMNSPNGTLYLMQGTEPNSLWPADESTTDSLRVASLLYDTLVRYDYGGTTIVPDLATSYSPNSDLTQWTFNLRYGVTFTNGATLDANDVVASFAAIWDAKDANHKGHTGNFTIFQHFFGNLLNSK